MAYSTINKASDFFNTLLYVGNGTDAHAITGVGFSPALVWHKNRTSSTDHYMHNTALGVEKAIRPNVTSGIYDTSINLQSFDSDGFTVGTQDGLNQNSNNICAWNWKAGTTSGLSGGTITPSAYSINTTSKFGIYKYTGNGSSSQTIAHGLGGTPTCVIFKQTSGSEQWRVHFMKATNPYTHMLILNSNVGESSQSNGLSAVSSTTITFGSDGAYNLNGEDYICYVFCDVIGFSKAGSYTGNGVNPNGVFLYTGFKPAWSMIKKINVSGESWIIHDNKRSPSNIRNEILSPDSSYLEETNHSTKGIDFVSNGIKIRNSDGVMNQNGATYVYLAFAEAPLVGSNNVPCTAT